MQHVILIGDINIDFMNLTNIQLWDYLSLFSLKKKKNVITEPTRITVNSSTLLDPVIISDACAVLNSGTMDVDEYISDHICVYSD